MLRRSLQGLDLSNTRIDDAAAVVLLDALWTNRSLCRMNLCGNPFGKVAARLLGVLIMSLPAERFPDVLIAGCALERPPALLVVRPLSDPTGDAACWLGLARVPLRASLLDSFAQLNPHELQGQFRFDMANRVDRALLRQVCGGADRTTGRRSRLRVRSLVACSCSAWIASSRAAE